MNDLLEVWGILTQYPTCVPFYMFLLTTILMMVSFISGIESDTHLHMDVHLLDDLLVSAGVSKVPLVIGLCLTFMPMTVITVILQAPLFNTLQAILPEFLYYIVSAIALLILFVGSLYIGGFLSKPIAKFIESNTSYVVNYIGVEAYVFSKTVDSTFGEIKCVINDSEHLLKAYSDEVIAEDTKVIIVEYNEEKDKYLIIKA